ncbi:MAG: hypothetical protein AAF937_03435 [Planctomycetota bacterium]
MRANMSSRRKLNSQSRRVLALIADGCSYDQILDRVPGTTYKDIFDAAGRALSLLDRGVEIARGEPSVAKPQPSAAPASGPVPGRTMEEQSYIDAMRERHARAYEPWQDAEDRSLKALVRGGIGVGEIASRLQRKPSAIQSRMRKLSLCERNAS